MGYNNELYHHGILGMKWGVRRYQNKDGSYTAAGKKRYSEDVKSMSTDELRKKVNRMNMENRYIDLTKSTSSTVSRASDNVEKASKVAGDGNKIYKTTKGNKDPKGKLASQTIDGVSRTARVAKKIDSTISDKSHTKKTRIELESMSDSDLAKSVERLNLERQYSRLQKNKIDSGKVHVSEVLDIAGDVIGIGASAVAIAVGIKKLMGK